MKSKYTRADAQVICLPVEDVIRTSGNPITPESYKFGSGDHGRSDGLQSID